MKANGKTNGRPGLRGLMLREFKEPIMLSSRIRTDSGGKLAGVAGKVYQRCPLGENHYSCMGQHAMEQQASKKKWVWIKIERAAGKKRQIKKEKNEDGTFHPLHQKS